MGSDRYDALLVCAFGGPEKPEDVVPFLQNVTRGKGIPEDRLVEVGEHYYRFEGKSPLNEQNLALVAALRAELQARAIDLPVLWGNRNWHPYSVDTLRDARAFGARRILVFLNSAYSCYSSVRQYSEHLTRALEQLNAEHANTPSLGTAKLPPAELAHEDVLQLDILRPCFQHPGFIQANVEAIVEACENTFDSFDESVHIAYVTHSIPETMELASGRAGLPRYAEQHEDVRAQIDEALKTRYGCAVSSSLSYCSRSGSPHVPWLEPDINDRLEELAESGVKKVVIAPIGFTSDHMEVIYDLDIEATETAKQLHLEAVRADTVGVRAPFVQALVDLIEERIARENGESVEAKHCGAFALFPDEYPTDACYMRDGHDSQVPARVGFQKL